MSVRLKPSPRSFSPLLSSLSLARSYTCSQVYAELTRTFFYLINDTDQVSAITFFLKRINNSNSAAVIIWANATVGPNARLMRPSMGDTGLPTDSSRLVSDAIVLISSHRTTLIAYRTTLLSYYRTKRSLPPYIG